VPDRLVPNDHFALLTAGAISAFSNANGLFSILSF
jgi:hypothetical protein